MIASYLGIVLGFFNRFYFFVLFLSEEEIGLVSVLLSTGALFGNVSLLGRTSLLRKFFPFFKLMPHRKGSFVAYNLMVTMIGIAFFGSVMFIFQDFIIDFFREKSPMIETYYPLIFFTGAAFALFYFFEGYLKVLYKNVFSTIANEVILRVLMFALILCYAMSLLPFGVLVVGLSILQFTPALLLTIYLYSIGERPFQFKNIIIAKRIRKIFFSYAIYSYLNSLASILITSLDLLMISSLMGLTYTGIYSIVVYMVRVLTIPYTALTRVASPLVAQYWKDRDMSKMSSIYKDTSSISLIIGLFAFLGVWVSREDLFGLLSSAGGNFELGIYAFLFLMGGRVVDMFFGLNGVILVTSKKYRYDSIFNGILLLAAFGFNLWLIPLFGLAGAGLATCFALVLQNVSRTVLVWKQFDLHPFTWGQLKVLFLFSAVFVLFHFFIPSDFGNVWLNMLIKSVLVALLFPFMIYLLRLEPVLVDYIDKFLIKLKLGQEK